ncbi:MAG: MFS transporter [Limisphaerales bacterium]
MNDRPTSARYGTLVWLVLAAALAYLCRNAVGVAESTIREDLALSLKQSGWFMGAFFWTYAIMQVPSGWFAQRQGTRIALTVFASAWCIATFGIAVAPAFWLLLTAQLIMGVAQAGSFPASCNTIGHWMPMAQRSLGCGLLAAGMQVGAITASMLTGGLIEAMNWRIVFALFALPGMVWAIAFAIGFRNRPEESPAVNKAELELIRSGKDSDSGGEAKPFPWRELAGNPAIYFLCGQQVCRAAGYMFFASWFPTFLQETRDISVKDSGYLQGCVLSGTFVGSILGGWITDQIWRRTQNLRFSRSGVGAICLFVCAVLILCAWFVQSVPLAVTLLTLGAFFAALAGPCALTATIDIGGDHVPQVFGLMNMCGNFAAASTPILVGWLFDYTSNWNLVLLLFAGVYVLGAIAWACVNPVRKTD